MRLIKNRVGLAALVALAALVVPGGRPSIAADHDDWTTYRGGAARAGVSLSTGPSSNPVELWNVQTGGGINSEPVVVGGVVYVGSDDGNFYALDQATGAERWRVETGDVVQTTAAVADGVV